MQKTNQILIAIVLLLFSNNFYGQTHTITLNVDTSNLNSGNASSEDISSFDAPESIVEIASPPEDFTIVVENGSTIIWEGASTSSDDSINIIMIKRERGPRILGPNDDIPGNENGRGRVYQIDPKIKVGS